MPGKLENRIHFETSNENYRSRVNFRKIRNPTVNVSQVVMKEVVRYSKFYVPYVSPHCYKKWYRYVLILPIRNESKRAPNRATINLPDTRDIAQYTECVFSFPLALVSFEL